MSPVWSGKCRFSWPPWAQLPSSYTWVEATRDQQMEAWLRAHIHAFDYWGGVPAPGEAFDMSQWSRTRVNSDYHEAFDANLYSVLFNLVHEVVEIRSTPTTVEILHKTTRVASHLRSRGRGQAVTNHEHRPKSHEAHLECIVLPGFWTKE